MPVDNLQFHMKRQQNKLFRAEQGIANQTRLRDLRDDPSAAAHSVRYQSQLERLERYSRNIERTIDRRELGEQYLREGIDIMQRIRELAVQTSHGIYSAEERMLASSEVEELLKEFISIANAREADGTMLFSGTRSRSEAFRVIYGTAGENREQVVTAVEYAGNMDINRISISENASVAINMPGNSLFWSEQSQIFSTQNALEYQITEPAEFSIDGQIIAVDVGDTLSSMVEKINNSAASVKASIDPVVGSLTLETTQAHQIWIRDEVGTVMNDLGIIQNNRPPYNIANSAEHSDDSIFDVMIHFRDSLRSNDAEAIGSAVLGRIDNALESLTVNLAESGSLTERLNLAYKRNEFAIPEVQDMNSKEVGLDLAEAITNMKMLEYAYQATLSSAGRLLQPSLLDYLQ